MSIHVEMAAAVDATLTLVHITASVETFGPGGSSLRKDDDDHQNSNEG